MRVLFDNDRSGNASYSGRAFMERKDTPWVRYKVDARSGVMTGIHISACEGAVPRATPFHMQFRNGNVALRQSDGFAMLILAQLSREDVFLEGSQKEPRDDDRSQLAAWENFLQGGEVDEKVETDRLEISREDFNASLNSAQHVRNTSRGALSITRGRHLSVGAPLSGFDAIKAASDPKRPSVAKKPEGLDIESAKKALRGVSRPSSVAVSWYGQAPEPVRELRMQAAGAMPVLAGLIAESRDLSRAVDNMDPIQPLLTARTGLPKAGVKRVGKLTSPLPAGPIFEAGETAAGEDALGVNRTRRFSVNGAVSVDKAMRHLADLSADRTPSTDAEWDAFHDVLTGCAIPVSNAFDIPVKTVLDASKGNWVSYKETLAKAADFDPAAFDRRAMALTTIDAIEAVEGFSRTAVMPQVLSSIRETGQDVPPVTAEFMSDAFDVSSKLCVGKAKNAAAHLFEIARRYASRIPAMMEIEGRAVEAAEERREERFGEYGETAFPVLTEAWTASNGLVVTPLRNAEDLRAEGEAMRHCVGGYTQRARSGSCHLYSVRKQDGERLSTVEIEGVNGDDAVTAAANLRMRQNRGVRNAKPSDEAESATKEFLRNVKSGDVPILYDEIIEWRKHYRGNGGDAARNQAPETTWASVLEFDWTDETAKEAMWEEWRTVIGGQVGKSPHSGAVYKEKDARDLVAAMNPRAAAILMERAREDREETPGP